MKKTVLPITGIVIIVISALIIIGLSQQKQPDEPIATNFDEMIDITNTGNFLFKVYAKKDVFTYVDGEKTWGSVTLQLDSSKSDLYKEIGNLDDSKNIAIIVPVFTASAYREPGFYTYYRGECDDSCLTVKLTDDFTWHSSDVAIQIFKLLGYTLLTDLDVHKNPTILEQFDKIVVLHNEYVTKKEFDAITNHKHVIYLYPNALYAEVTVNADDSITLARGHNYPTPDIKNGFDWIHDNSSLEYDYECANMIFSRISNGFMLNCYPENEIAQNPDLLQKIKEL